MTTPALSIRHGSVALGGRPVLRHIDLRVEHGQFLALMGANGSGKSTLVRSLLGLHPLTEGQVELLGTRLEDFEEWQRVGFVPQRASATSGVPASVWELVASGRLTHRRLLRPLSRADRAAIEEALEVVGLGDRRRDTVSTLSGGQQQRVLIARALAGRPELLLLDEPNAGVDLPNQHALADTLDQLKQRGATVVLVAHELGPLARLIDRAAVMRDGRIAYDGPPLDDHEMHQPWLATPHIHHSSHDAPDHAPSVSAPLEATEGEQP